MRHEGGHSAGEGAWRGHELPDEMIMKISMDRAELGGGGAREWDKESESEGAHQKGCAY